MRKLLLASALLALCGCDSWISGVGVSYEMPDDEGAVSVNVQFGHQVKAVTIPAEVLDAAPVAVTEKPSPKAKAIRTKEAAAAVTAKAAKKTAKKKAEAVAPVPNK